MSAVLAFIWLVFNTSSGSNVCNALLAKHIRHLLLFNVTGELANNFKLMQCNIKNKEKQIKMSTCHGVSWNLHKGYFGNFVSFEFTEQCIATFDFRLNCFGFRKKRSE